MVSSSFDRLLSLRGVTDYNGNVGDVTIIPVDSFCDVTSSKNNHQYHKQRRHHIAGTCVRTAVSYIPCCGILLLIILTLLWGKLYVRNCLVWLESQDRETVCVMFILMYTFVAFPLTWGYILLNFACGYHFGLLFGVLVTVGAATLGISVAHTVMKRFFLGFIMARLLTSDFVKSTLALLDSGHAFKVVIISRLTPIPFGLQNAMFAVSHMSLGKYVFASALGLVPTQIINVYLGTTVRSMEDVLDDEGTATAGYAVIVAQVVLSILLMVLIVQKARRELRDAVLSSGCPKLALDTALRADFPWIPVAPIPECASRYRLS
ncbi:transmembrane protein 64-like [Ornithodoros turicata]|uniref:transmembrane protein 64-like n=1 Tax=Ornithodoros turicata TaxID=34597 RepID=UPI003138C738